MMLDHIDVSARYAGVHPGLARGLAFLREYNLDELDVGRHPIDGDRVFALVQTYTSRPAEDGRWEAHRLHLDIQTLASGVERIGWADVQTLEEETPYSVEKDIAFYRGTGGLLILRPGWFMVLGPDDAHMPGIAAPLPGPVKKVVIKIRLA